MLIALRCIFRLASSPVCTGSIWLAVTPTPPSVGSSITWDDSTYEAQGSGNMAAYLASEEYAIGYIDAGHGHDDGLAEVELENADGLFQSSLEAAERGGKLTLRTQ